MNSLKKFKKHGDHPMKKILIINGPNLNMLGQREPEIYGTQTLQDIENMCETTAKIYNVELLFRQSNHEGDLIDWIQGAHGTVDGLIINAAAYTHTSIAIHDALKILSIPVIEVHLSDPKTRESFRHVSYVEPVATAVFAGLGAQGYLKAIEKLVKG